MDANAVHWVYLNLDRDRERRESFEREFPGIPWERFPGVPGSWHWIRVGQSFGLVSEDPWKRNLTRDKTPMFGTIGCGLSHLLVLRSFLKSRKEVLVFFPDDVRKARPVNLKQELLSMAGDLPAGCDWLKVKNHFPKLTGKPVRCGNHLARRLLDRDKCGARGNQVFNTGSAAVIVTRKGAQVMLKDHPAVDGTGIDVIWSERYSEVGAFAITPNLVLTNPGEKNSSRVRMNKLGNF